MLAKFSNDALHDQLIIEAECQEDEQEFLSWIDCEVSGRYEWPGVYHLGEARLIFERKPS